VKRLFDIIVSFVLLVCLSPFIFIIALMVKRKIGSPVFFTQKRPGLKEKPFILLKFRTMTNKQDSRGDLLPDQVRLTKFGTFLRKYSLDELIQLVNVLKGDISLVGPRPLLMEYLPLYNEDQKKRHLVRPGITGWAQVNGRNAISWEEKFELDVWYVENHNFFLDLKILFMTFMKVINSEGINQNENITMDVFKGSASSAKEG
jgi:sugar transferase EpsL